MSVRKFRSWFALVAVVAVVSCGDETTTPSGDDDDDTDTSAESAEKDRDAGKKVPVAKDAGTRKDAGNRSSKPATDDSDDADESDDDKAPTGSGTMRDGGSSSASGGGGGTGGGNDIPCDVQTVVDKHCALCHGKQPTSGAFPLTVLSEFQGPARSDKAKKMHEVAHARVNSTGKDRMPPTTTLPESELKTLSEWLEGGAKGGTKCGSGTTTPPTEGDGGTATAPGKANGMGGAQIEPIDYNDPDLECHKFVAYTRGDKTKPYSVPTRPDFYVAFNIKPTWQGVRYIRSFKNIIDNKDVIHHWLMFKLMAPDAESVTENALGVHPDAEMLYGWAPGGDDMYMHPDVGMEINSNVTYQLEAHYNNDTGSPKPDASGVEICMTKTKPKNVAALSWVGTDSISSATATGTCTPSKNQVINIIAAQPHMHTKGKHMKVVVNRKNGMKETIHDQPFNFEFQRMYPMNVVLQPGDTMTTTCSYTGPARFGKGTNDEMCYFFSIHWPANTLVSSGGIGSVIHGPNSCLN